MCKMKVNWPAYEQLARRIAKPSEPTPSRLREHTQHFRWSFIIRGTSTDCRQQSVMTYYCP